MFSKRFEKETFKQTVKDNIRTLYRKTIEEATPQQLFQAVSYAVKDVIFDDWFATQKAYDEADAKTVYYMSMEFLMGRALGNNLINMTVYKDVKEALDEMGIDLNVSSSRKRGSGKTGGMFPGFTGYPELPGIRMRYPLPLWYVQTEDRERLPEGSAGRLVKRGKSV